MKASFIKLTLFFVSLYLYPFHPQIYVYVLVRIVNTFAHARSSSLDIIIMRVTRSCKIGW